MHCPRCGQQQVSNETKFCSRCGFQLAIVSELILHGGTLPQLAELNNKKTFFNKKNGVLFSTFWFIFFTMFMTSVWAILNAPEELVAFCAVTGIFGGLLLLIGSLVVLPSSKRPAMLPGQDLHSPTPQQAGLYGTAAPAALLPQQQQPASVYTAPAGSWRAPDTGDLVERGSIVEGTTKLLKKDE